MIFRKKKFSNKEPKDAIEICLISLIFGILIFLIFLISSAIQGSYEVSNSEVELGVAKVISKYKTEEGVSTSHVRVGKSVVPISGGSDKRFIIEINLNDNLNAISVPKETYESISVNDKIKLKIYTYKDKITKVEYLGNAE